MKLLRFLLTGLVLFIVGLTVTADAQPLGRQTQTSSACHIANIKKGISGKTCEVAIPKICKVAINVATNTHWADIEKSAGISCRFDNTRTDWKTRITGTCGPCQARQCSAKFTVYFDCPQSDETPKAP